MSAIISNCGLYRYRLERHALGGAGAVAWIMVNPSTADATEDDATIRKVIGFSNRMGAGWAIVGNKFAYRATDVTELKRVRDPIGPDNDQHLRDIIASAATVIVAWGPLAKLPKHLRRRWCRVAKIADEIGRPLMCFGTAQDGHPRHPLMLAYDTPLVEWKRPGAANTQALASGKAEVATVAEREGSRDEPNTPANLKTENDDGRS